MPDWTEWLTEEERARLRIYERVLESGFRDGIGFLKYDVMPLFQALAASRALVAEWQNASACSYAIRGLDPCYRTERTPCPVCRIRALTEADMLERLEEK